MKRLGIIVALSAFAGNLCAVSAAQPLSEEQARSVIAPWYGLFNIGTRCDVRTIQEQVLTADYETCCGLFLLVSIPPALWHETRRLPRHDAINAGNFVIAFEERD